MAMITTSIQALQAALPGKRIWELDITRRGRPYIHEKLEAELGVTDDQQPIPLLAVLNTCGLSDAVWALRATAVDPSLLRQYLSALDVVTLSHDFAKPLAELLDRRDETDFELLLDRDYHIVKLSRTVSIDQSL